MILYMNHIIDLWLTETKLKCSDFFDSFYELQHIALHCTIYDSCDEAERKKKLK